MTSKEITLSKIRQWVFETIKNNQSTIYSDIVKNVHTLAKKEDIIIEERTDTYGKFEIKVREVIWDLIIERVLSLGANESSAWPYLVLTEHGKEIVTISNPNPYDPEGYFSELINNIANIDNVILEYLTESLISFRNKAILAAYVTLGCASEKAIYLLFDSFINYDKSNSIVKVLDDKNVGINKKIDRFSKEVLEKLPHMVGDIENRTIQRFLLPAIELIRIHRNVAGHPINIDKLLRDNITILYSQFIFALKMIYHLIDYFTTKTKPIS